MCSGRIGTIEAVEQSREILGFNLFACIFNNHFDRVFISRNVNLNISLVGCMSYRIGEQITYRAAEHQSITLNVTIAMRTQIDSFFLGDCFIEL